MNVRAMRSSAAVCSGVVALPTGRWAGRVSAQACGSGVGPAHLGMHDQQLMEYARRERPQLA
jgi:hypothetical protein